MAEHVPHPSVELPAVSAQGGGGQLQRRCMPLLEAPVPWLQLLVDNTLSPVSLRKLMAASWSMCRKVLNCMQARRLQVVVSAVTSSVLQLPLASASSACGCLL
jgi:hypothetical protein